MSKLYRTEKQKAQVASNSMSYSQYKRPGPINLDSLLDNKAHVLRHNLMEHYDFEAILPEVWRLLQAWYGNESELIPIIRPVCFDRRSNKFFVDLYLEFNKEQSTLLGEDDDTEVHSLV